MIPLALRARAEAALGSPLCDLSPVGGGSIARAARGVAGGVRVFLKWGGPDVARTFEAEADGLRAMRAVAGALVVPRVWADVYEADGAGLLVLEWIDPGQAGAAFWTTFGEALAALHQRSAEAASGPLPFGWDRDNFIGRLPQSNTRRATWTEFFAECRLGPQVARARAAGRWEASWEASFARLLARLDDLIPAAPAPALLHGDLWCGNFLVTSGGRAALVDPAVYTGDREADLAMTELFGGFDARFYEAYRTVWPLAPGYETRRDLYNLYHLLNHLNHFGGSYAGAVASALRRLSR